MKYLINFILVLCLILCFAGQGFTQENRTDGSTKDIPAADFILKDLNGKDYSLSNYKGKTVLLNFMTTWCPECKASISYLKSIHAKFSQRGLIIFNINVMQSEEKAAAFSKKYALPYPTLMDHDGKISKDYGVVGVPVKVLIDREGRIICWNCNSMDKLIEEQFTGKGK